MEFIVLTSYDKFRQDLLTGSWDTELPTWPPLEPISWDTEPLPWPDPIIKGIESL